MDDPTSLLFGLDGFVVLDVEGVGVERATVRVVVETETAESACPSCGVLSSRVKDRPLCRIKDLPASGQVVQLWWRKRRLVCLAGPQPYEKSQVAAWGRGGALDIFGAGTPRHMHAGEFESTRI